MSATPHRDTDPRARTADAAAAAPAPARPLRLLTLVQKGPDVAPNQRFRHEQWAPHLSRDHGITLDFDAFESPELSDLIYRSGRRVEKARLTLRDSLRRWGTGRRVDAFDGVVVLREALLVGGAWLERRLAARGVPLVYDFDDAIWRHDVEGRSRAMTWLRAPWKVAAICRAARLVTVGNEYLAGFARQHAATVAVVPTSIDVDRYPEIPPPPAGAPFTVVWSGSHSTLPMLDALRPALERVARQIPLRLRVVCDVAPEPLGHGEVEFVRWRAASEAADLAPAHVGLMPLPDTPFARGKCGCKALQYMAIGRPAVVSPVGVNRDIVRDGDNGRWATTPEEWERALLQLAADPSARDRMGRAARQTVQAGYSARASADAFARAVRGAITARAAAR